MKKCLYCSCEISEGSIIDFCHKCGVSVFGEKMLKAIISNMENAKEKGDLHQGLVTCNDSEIEEKRPDFDNSNLNL